MASTVRSWQDQQRVAHHDHHGYHEIHMGHPNHVLQEEEEEEEEEVEGEEHAAMDDASSMSSSPSIPDENINFDLVYALHTFVATVEGQASVVKGDALILMEDTNIYWWLVEVLKTREVGYIPAENIETPYERLARLNKHRNVDITQPGITSLPVLFTLSQSRKKVTIASGEDEHEIIHYEVESDEEDNVQDDGDDSETSDEEFKDAQDIVEMHPEKPSEQVGTGAFAHRVSSDGNDNGHLATTAMAKPREEDGIEEREELRVFAGNIGQSPLFHTFAITGSTTADELVQEALIRFKVQADTTGEGTVEYYLAVQGLDGDDYVLSAQDKPLSIFKTLTAPLTTPMPSVSHIRRIPPAAATPNPSEPSPSRRARSSSFSNYEQTSYDEDSVIRFYLHRRIKRAHEREGLIYIKVSLYPDESAINPPDPPSKHPLANRDKSAFTTNPTPVTVSSKKKKVTTTRTEVDRMDKIMAVKQDQQVGAVINMALSKFHVPDAEAADYHPPTRSDEHPLSAPARRLSKYRMSVRSNGREIDLDANEYMSAVLHQQRQSLPQGPITSDLLFIVRCADHDKRRHDHSTMDSMDASIRAMGPLSVPDPILDERRPSILDILMDSPRSTEDRRPSFLSSPRDDRRPSFPSSLSSQDRKSSVAESEIHSPSPGGLLSPPNMSGFRRTSLMSVSNISASSASENASTAMDGDPNHSMARSASLQPVDNKRRKESSFKQQLKRLVGWGSRTKKTPPPPLGQQPSTTESLNALGSVSSIALKSPALYESQVSIMSAPPTPLTPSPMSPYANKLPALPASEPTTPMTSSPMPVDKQSTSNTIHTVERPVSNVSSISSTSLESDGSDEKTELPDDNSDSDDGETSDEEESVTQAPNASLPSVSAVSTSSASGDQPKTTAEPVLNEIQTQYAMWMDSQKSLAESDPTSPVVKNVPPVPPKENPPQPEPAPSAPIDPTPLQPDNALSSSPSSTSTTSSNTSATSSSMSSITTKPLPVPATGNQATENTSTEAVAKPSVPSPHPMATSEDSEIDDLYLLVTHGVDYLQTREGTRWDDQGGYEFHPWNRPHSSFAVQKENHNPLPESVIETTIAHLLGDASTEKNKQTTVPPSLSQQSSDAQEHPTSPLSPINTASSTEDTPRKPAAKPSPRPMAVRHPVTEKITPQNDGTLDEELQRIVVSHIVF